MKELAIWLIESVTVTEGSPILVDTGAFGTLYLGATKWAVNPYEEFRTNRSRGRLEVPMLVFVERPEAIVEITLAERREVPRRHPWRRGAPDNGSLCIGTPSVRIGRAWLLSRTPGTHRGTGSARGSRSGEL